MSTATISSNPNERLFRTIHENTLSAFTTAKTTFESQYPLLDLRDNQLIELQQLFKKHSGDPSFSTEPRALQFVPFKEALKQARGLSDTLENLATSVGKDLVQLSAVNDSDFGSPQQTTIDKIDGFARNVIGKIQFFKDCIDALHDQMETRLHQVTSILSPQDEEWGGGQTWMPESPLIVLPSASRVPFLSDISELRSRQQLKDYSLEAQLRECSALSSSSSSSSSSFFSTMSPLRSSSLELDGRYEKDLRRRNAFRFSHLESSGQRPLKTVTSSSHSAMQQNSRGRVEELLVSIEKHIQDLEEMDRLFTLKKADLTIQSRERGPDQSDQRSDHNDTPMGVVTEDPLTARLLTASERMDSKPRTPPITTPSTPVRSLSSSSESDFGMGKKEEMQLEEDRRKQGSNETRLTPFNTDRDEVPLSGKEREKPGRICGGPWVSCTARKQYVQGLNESDFPDRNTASPRNPHSTMCIIL